MTNLCGTPSAQGGKPSGAADRDLPATGVCHEPPHQIEPKSGVVDNLDEEAVRNCVERLRDVHRYGYSYARGLTLIEARDYPSRNGAQGRGGGVPISSHAEKACGKRLHDGREKEQLQYIHCRGRAVRWGGSSDPGLVASLPSKSGL